MTLKRILNNFITFFIPENLLLNRGDSDTNSVALTFDDGPYPANTEKILEILRKYNIKATFFMNGIAIERYKDAVIEVLNDGHEIGNHLYNHKAVKDLTYCGLKREIESCWQVLERLRTNKNLPRIIRPPYGKLNIKIFRYAFTNKATLVLWSLDSRDLLMKSANDALNYIDTVSINSGEIILLHEDSKYITEILEYIINKVLSKDLKFCTISELHSYLI